MKKYDDILRNIQKKAKPGVNDHILLVDSMNTFIRNFTMINLLTPQGHHIGGLVGFLKSLGYLVRTIQPSRVVLAFDGPGSTIARKNVDSNYKANRNLSRITNWEIYDNKEEERDSMANQMERLIDYLQALPVQMLTIPKIEADDTIGYIVQQYKHQSNITIVSSDKDFLQLVTDNVNVYSPVKKVFYTPEMVRKDLGVIPKNYLLYKALVGDNSDNLPGVKGLGAKTIWKMFPEMQDNPEIGLDYIFETCEKNIKNGKRYGNVLERMQRVETNYELMNIQEPVLMDSHKNHILEVMNRPIPSLNTTGFLTMLEHDNIQGGITKNPEGWLEIFRNLTIH